MNRERTPAQRVEQMKLRHQQLERYEIKRINRMIRTQHQGQPAKGGTA